MSTSDRMSNAAEGTKGKIKETAGKAADDPQLEADGKMDQTKAKIKDKFEDVKDTVAEKFNDMKDRDKK